MKNMMRNSCSKGYAALGAVLLLCAPLTAARAEMPAAAAEAPAAEYAPFAGEAEVRVVPCGAAQGRADEVPPVTLDLHGTLRAKFEYQPDEGNARFQVRNARLSAAGEIYRKFSYCMELDLSDEGQIKVVNAYLGARICKGLKIDVGYLRIPFTIDAHRAPHAQSFANRSFVAKQVGGKRDVGAVLGWSFGEKVPVVLQAGMFNDTGMTGQKDYWTGRFGYSGKVIVGALPQLNFVASYRTTRPADVRMHLYNAGCTFRSGGWIVEAEYVRKEYEGEAFKGVDAFDGFFGYDLPLRRVFRKMSFLGRYDYMDRHSGGRPDAAGVLTADDARRHRLTAGLTFSLALPFTADIRLNYEKYLYARDVTPKASEHDKIVVELVAHF